MKKQPALGAAAEKQFFDEMNQALAGWRDPAAHLREALQKDELQLYCQPILTLHSGRYEIAEVLVRLRREEETLLPPGEFLPVFEHFHMMPDLDRWVARNAIDRLRKGSLIDRFSINVSGQTLADREFPGFVADELKRAGVPAAALLFEIDESDALRQPPEAETFASLMKAVGCGLLVDSFARRSVSFSQLKALHVDFVKVDGSVVRNILRSAGALAKLRAVLRVGEVIGIDVIAECVEDQDILLRLKALGVSHAQGFGISEPHAIEKLAKKAQSG